MMTHYCHFHQQNSASSYHHRNKEQFQNHLIGIPKLMKMHLKTFEHPRTPCFRENPPPRDFMLDIIRVKKKKKKKKNHVIRVVFQDQVMYTRVHRTLGVQNAKTCKIGKKGCVFGHMTNFRKGHDGQINACKNAYLGSIFIPEKKKNVFRVCFESPFTRMISSLKYKCHPGIRLRIIILIHFCFCFNDFSII